MSTDLIEMEIDEVSLVDKGANPGAKMLIFKREETEKRCKYKEYAMKNSYTDEQEAEFMAMSEDERDNRMNAKPEGKGMTKVDETEIEKRLADLEGSFSKREKELKADLEKREATLKEELAKRDAELSILKAENELVSLEKRANGEWPNLKGDVRSKAKLLKAVEGMEEDVKKFAMEVIKSADAYASDMLSVTKSHSSMSKAAAGADKLQVLAKAYERENKVSPAEAYGAVINTEEGKAAYLESIAN